jgi:hypothetical protein
MTFRQYEEQQRLRAATELAGIINNDAPAPVCNIPVNMDDNEQRISAALVDNGIINNDAASPVSYIADSINDNEQWISVAPVVNIIINMMRLLMFVTSLRILMIMSSCGSC